MAQLLLFPNDEDSPERARARLLRLRTIALDCEGFPLVRFRPRRVPAHTAEQFLLPLPPEIGDAEKKNFSSPDPSGP